MIKKGHYYTIKLQAYIFFICNWYSNSRTISLRNKECTYQLQENIELTTLLIINIKKKEIHLQQSVKL